MEIYTPSAHHVGSKKILAISAHQDDIELMAYGGIYKTITNPNYSFTAVVCSDGRNSPRLGEFAEYTDEMMMACRRQEQISAADIGRYERLYLLNYTSEQCRQMDNKLIDDLIKIILDVKPDIIMTHNPMDKHSTHLGVAIHVIKALLRIRDQFVPNKVLGCEVWRDLDWIDDDEKIVIDCGKDPQLQYDLLNVFVSQVAGGKRYDKAGVGRRYANATFFASHNCDDYQMINYAVDLKPLIENDRLSVEEFCLGYVNRFRQSISDALKWIK